MHPVVKGDPQGIDCSPRLKGPKLLTREEELFHGLAAPLTNLASPQVATVSSQATLGEVCVKLSAVDVGALLVRDTVGVIGLLTDRDLVHALAAGAHPDGATAESVATSDVLWLSPPAPATRPATHGHSGCAPRRRGWT